MIRSGRDEDYDREIADSATAKGYTPSMVEVIARKGAEIALAYGDTFYLSAAIADTIMQAARQLPDDVRLERELVPVAHGFIWFERDVPFAAPRWGDSLEHMQHVRALSWAPVGPDDRAASIALRDQARIVEVSDGLLYCTYLTQQGVPCRAETLGMPFGRPINLHKWDIQRQHERGEADVVPDLYEAPEVAERMKFLIALFAFMASKIVVTETQHAPRATQRRLEAKGSTLPPLVRVVMLRKRAHVTGETAEHKLVEWSCRWIVSGHWRNQFYPSDGTHRLKYILPYDKGPEGKPLRVTRATINALVR
jgi:hypothetical protein